MFLENSITHRYTKIYFYGLLPVEGATPLTGTGAIPCIIEIKTGKLGKVDLIKIPDLPINKKGVNKWLSLTN
ncbi:MAG: hypothetical protein NT178_11405 [Proteobacteria bacterium]|nr:hypothetical protein [Pseudomonadota bacterium]